MLTVTGLKYKHFVSIAVQKYDTMTKVSIMLENKQVFHYKKLDGA